MPVSSRKRDAASDDAEEGPPRVGAYESRPGRLVFIEEGNADAWMSTDLALDPWR